MHVWLLRCVPLLHRSLPSWMQFLLLSPCILLCVLFLQVPTDCVCTSVQHVWPKTASRDVSFAVHHLICYCLSACKDQGCVLAPAWFDLRRLRRRTASCCDMWVATCVFPSCCARCISVPVAACTCIGISGSGYGWCADALMHICLQNTYKRQAGKFHTIFC